MKKQLLVMISLLCLMASPAFAQVGPGHFEDITQVGPSIPPDFPTCASGTVLTYDGHVFSCSHNLTISGCPAGQALNAESGAGGVGSFTCENLTCGANQALEYTNDNAAPTCMPAVPPCTAGEVLTYDGTKYSCTINVWLNLSCGAGQAIQSIAGGTAVCATISCPIGASLNTPSAGGPPSCIIPPSCALGQVLTYNVPPGSGYTCTSNIQTIACPANEALVSIAANGLPTCKKLPQFGGCPAGFAVNGVYTGGVVPTCVAIPNGACPAGQSMQGVGLTPACIPTAGSGPCPNGQVVTQLNGAGSPPTCAIAGEPGFCGLGEGVQAVHPVGNGAPTCTPLASKAGCGGGTYVNGVHGANPPSCGPITLWYAGCKEYYTRFGANKAACLAYFGPNTGCCGDPPTCDANGGCGQMQAAQAAAGLPVTITCGCDGIAEPLAGGGGPCPAPFAEATVACTNDGPQMTVCYDPAPGAWHPATSCLCPGGVSPCGPACSGPDPAVPGSANGCFNATWGGPPGPGAGPGAL